MREILFRSKRVDNGEWVYGFYVKHNEQAFIFPIFEEPYQYDQNSYEVIPKTVGQFTGLYDKHNKPIYEGDIVKFKSFNHSCNEIERVTFDKGIYYAGYQLYHVNNRCEVIGNVHENIDILAG